MLPRFYLRFIASKSPIEKLYFFTAMFATVNSFMQFGEVVARKSLGASALQITLLTMIVPVASVTSIWSGRFLSGRDQRKTIWYAGVVTAVALSTGHYLDTYWHLFLIFVVLSFSSQFYTLAQNRILQQYIPIKRTGKTFGVAQGIGLLVGAGFSALAGWWLDHFTQGWRTLFLLISVFSLLGVIALASVSTRKSGKALYHFTFSTLNTPLKEVVALLKRRKDFFRFESAFMLYGIAFMMQLPVVPLYLVDDLKLQYSDIGLARGTVFQLVMIAGVIFFGKVFDRTNPYRLSIKIFALGSLFPLLLLLSGYLDGTSQKVVMYLAFAVFGVVMSGVVPLWSLSSIRFAKVGEDSGVYQSVHIAATGVRGAFAPLLGLGMTTLFGNRIALLFASIVWLCASFAMSYVRKRDESTLPTQN